MSQNTLQSIEMISRIFFSSFMLILGLFLVIRGKFTIKKYSLRGRMVRLIGFIFLAGAALFFLYQPRGFFNRYSLLLQAIILLAGIVILWILTKKPGSVSQLPVGTHTLQSSQDEPAYRLHLRLNKDGTGILIVNAATVLHLNQSAAEFAYHVMKGSSESDVTSTLQERYHIQKEVILRDYAEFRDRIHTLIHTPDLDPVSYLDFERVPPHSLAMSAPLRLDCAITYLLPADSSLEYAPTKRVGRELSTSEWEMIMDKAWEFGIPHIVFTGGEPTLRDDLLALIAHAEKNGQVCGLLTNGLKLADKEYLHTLLRTGLDHLLFLLAPDSKVSWAALETIMPEDLFTTVHLTLTPDNIRSGNSILDRMAKLGVKSLSLGISESSIKESSLAIRNHAAELGLTIHWDLPVPYSADNPVANEIQDDLIPDGAGKVWLYVEPDGDVLPAQGEADKILGNLLRDPWDSIYHP